METKPRRRLTIAALMTGIAALALLLALCLPVLRQGPPPCLSAADTARWLAARPSKASCADCHGQVGVTDHLRALLPLASRADPGCAAGRKAGANSCATCHAK